MCQAPVLNLKRRVRLFKKDKKLYIDIMLNLEQMKSARSEVRRDIIVQNIAKDVPDIVSKYKITDFETERFNKDLVVWLGKF